MPSVITRRHLLHGALGTTALLALPSWATPDEVRARFAALEKSADITLGLWALDTGTGRTIAYRDDARFAFCSTFKAVLAGAVLHRDAREPGLLAKHIDYTADQLVVYSPVTEKYAGIGMNVADLCAAAVQYSDNTAGNLLLEQIGGPAGLTAFCRSIGDEVFRSDRIEPHLNSALPGDPRDTTTAQAMGRTLQRLLLDDTALPAAGRQQLQDWLKGNTTGAERIQAGLPKGWVMGDKTGSGDYGVANDVAIAWPPGRAPWIIVVFTRGKDQDTRWRSEPIAATTRLIVQALNT